MFHRKSAPERNNMGMSNVLHDDLDGLHLLDATVATKTPRVFMATAMNSSRPIIWTTGMGVSSMPTSGPRPA